MLYTWCFSNPMQSLIPCWMIGIDYSHGPLRPTVPTRKRLLFRSKFEGMWKSQRHLHTRVSGVWSLHAFTADQGQVLRFWSNIRWNWEFEMTVNHDEARLSCSMWSASMEQKLLSTLFHNSYFIRSVLKYSSKGPTRASKSLACDRDKNIIRNCILWVCNPAREMKWTCMHYTLPPTLYHILLQNQLHVCGVVLYHS
jgi:hypothetical protein